MGIGAYQVREYARAMGGQVHVHSEPGHGSRFEILMPLVEMDAGASFETRPARDQDRSSTMANGAKNVARLS
jgi:hypothetical protein